MINDFRLSPHFKLSEFQCLCCKRVKLDSRLIPVLENARAYVGLPVIITSGYRCPEHNRMVGGAPDSDHLYGWAADIVVDGVEPERLAQVVGYYLKDGRIFIYSDKRCVHIGVERREGLPNDGCIHPKNGRST